MSICYNVLHKSDRRKNEKLKKEGKMRISILILIYTIHFANLKVYTKFENTGSWEICDKFPLERKKNEQIKGLISNMWPFFYTIKLITIKLCTKFQNHKSSSLWDIFDRKKVFRQTNKQTDKQTQLQKRQKLYTPYILCTGGIITASVYCHSSARISV